MPLPCEHSARVRCPCAFRHGTLRSKRIRRGVRLILGKRIGGHGAMEVQAVRLDACEFSAEQARQWLREHGFGEATLEAARGDCPRCPT